MREAVAGGADGRLGTALTLAPPPPAMAIAEVCATHGQLRAWKHHELDAVSRVLMQITSRVATIVALRTRQRAGKWSGVICDTLTHSETRARSITTCSQCHCLTSVTLRYGLASRFPALHRNPIVTLVQPS